ncbi:MAG: tetratricopeptide repeat protein, partial [Polyangiaceae bacterium]|nr:tetratricopeptide repeat protein [Polyangiaceae bacterium]
MPTPRHPPNPTPQPPLDPGRDPAADTPPCPTPRSSSRAGPQSGPYSTPNTTRLPPSRSHLNDLAGSDFLYHLYRGTDLLQDNQVHEAKSEIENALRLQPCEPQGQALLAQVYFRLGLYPRSIAIYENLVDSIPTEPALLTNLALCYLKTGQPDSAREQLERVVNHDPTRKRAWGYLGLALERMGDYEKAHAAFMEAGHATMARRMEALSQAHGVRDTAPVPRDMLPPAPADVRSVVEVAFRELDASDDAFSLSLPSHSHVISGLSEWLRAGVDNSGAEHSESDTSGGDRGVADNGSACHRSADHHSANAQRNRTTPIAGGSSVPAVDERPTEPMAQASGSQPSGSQASGSQASGARASGARASTAQYSSAQCSPAKGSVTRGSSTIRSPAHATEKPIAPFTHAFTMAFPRRDRANCAEDGSVLMSLDSAFAARIDLVQTFLCDDQFVASTYVPKSRTDDTETHPGGTLSGLKSPLVSFISVRKLILRPAPGRALHVVTLASDGLFIHECCFAGIDLSVGYDHVVLCSGYGDTISFLHL